MRIKRTNLVVSDIKYFPFCLLIDLKYNLNIVFKDILATSCEILDLKYLWTSLKNILYIKVFPISICDWYYIKLLVKQSKGKKTNLFADARGNIIVDYDVLYICTCIYVYKLQILFIFPYFRAQVICIEKHCYIWLGY